MTGSSLAPIVIPIVVACTLAVWLGLVFHADARPGWQAHRAALDGSTGDIGLVTGPTGPTESQDGMTAAQGGPATADHGPDETVRPAQAPPPRRAA